MNAGLHPQWCSVEKCRAADGGSYMSMRREIPLSDGAVLAVRLVAMPEQAVSIELDIEQLASGTSPGSRMTLPASRARELIAAVSGCLWAAIGSRFGSTDIGDPQLRPAVALHAAEERVPPEERVDAHRPQRT